MIRGTRRVEAAKERKKRPRQGTRRFPRCRKFDWADRQSATDLQLSSRNNGHRNVFHLVGWRRFPRPPQNVPKRPNDVTRKASLPTESHSRPAKPRRRRLRILRSRRSMTTCLKPGKKKRDGGDARSRRVRDTNRETKKGHKGPRSDGDAGVVRLLVRCHFRARRRRGQQQGRCWWPWNPMGAARRPRARHTARRKGRGVAGEEWVDAGGGRSSRSGFPDQKTSMVVEARRLGPQSLSLDATAAQSCPRPAGLTPQGQVGDRKTSVAVSPTGRRSISTGGREVPFMGGQRKITRCRARGGAAYQADVETGCTTGEASA